MEGALHPLLEREALLMASGCSGTLSHSLSVQSAEKLRGILTAGLCQVLDLTPFSG